METRPARPKKVHRTKQKAGAKKVNRTKQKAYVTEALTITGQTYKTLDEAWSWFNTALFGGQLPGCLLTLARRANSKGYFSPERFGLRTGTGMAHELALNPDTFAGRSDTEILSTLVHEMTHCWQNAHGTPSRRGYHNREWADKMQEIGLIPSDTGEVGGKMVGQHVTHYIAPDGPFAHWATRWQQEGYVLLWQSAAPEPLPAKTGTNSKTKYTCPNCELNAWAKPDVHLLCGDCALPMAMQ